jgi:LuxR family transcriptional regulator, maltose regulon positive regulatory protein
MATSAFAMAGMALARMGRFAEAERRLDRAAKTLRASADPGTEVVLHHARGVLRFAEGRLEQALAEFTRADGLDGQIAGRHAFAVDVRGRALQVRVRMGDTDPAPFAALSPEQRDHAAVRVARAALALERDDPERAVEALAPVIEETAPALAKRWSRTEALVLTALARERLGDRAAAEASLEAALELAEPEGLILPFALWPCRELLDRHPRHRTAHATFISAVLDTLDGRAAPRRGPGAPPRDELSDAELRVVRYLPSNLTASEIASELIVSANTVRTHMRHIYAKLDAHSRSEAVARARELGLVAPGALRG